MTPLVAAAYFMENLDGTVITTAVPDMARSFGVAPLDLNVGVSAYLLTLGVFIPISGWIAERFGPRRVFTAALALFTLASLLCGMAQGLSEFALLRVLQGIGGAMMVPVGRLVILNHTPKHKLAEAIATLTWPALVAPVLGPPVGGFLASYLSWRWIFYLNLPFGLAAIWLAWRILPAGSPGRSRPFDLPGFVLVGSSLWSLSWSAEVMTRPDTLFAHAAPYLVAGVALLALAAWHLRRAASPLFDLEALRNRTFAVTIFGGSLARMSIGAVPFLLPLMFQVGFGLDAFRSGLLLLAVFAGNLLMKLRTTHLLRRFGFKRILLVNGVLNAGTMLACAMLSPTTPVWMIALVLFVGGLSRSMQFSAYNTIAFADVPKDRLAAANTLSSTVFQVAAGLGIAVGAFGVRFGHWVQGAAGLEQPAVAFRLAFVVIAVVGLVGTVDALRLAPGAGANTVGK
ncbi:MFS transporter [Massilia horti]|nr:MFS transporter [Massilia horti]